MVPDPSLDKLTQVEEDLINSVCEVAPEEQICKDFSKRDKGFYSSAVNLKPPSGAKSAGKLKLGAKNEDIIEAIAKAMQKSDLSKATVLEGEGKKLFDKEFEKAQKVTAQRKSDATGGSVSTSAEQAQGGAGESGGGEDAQNEESAAEAVSMEGGSGPRSYSGPGFRAKLRQIKGGGQPAGGVPGGSDQMGFAREPASTKDDIAPKTANGLFKIISDRYEVVSKTRLLNPEDDIIR
jgi:hypothetical protein